MYLVSHSLQRWGILAVSCIALIVFSSASYAAETGGIGGKPANPRSDNPRSQSIFVYESAPGSVLEDAVDIYNNTETVKTISVYATDSVVSSGGAFACAQAADAIKDVGGWIKLSTNQVTLEPNTNITVPFTVSIPEFAEPGEHNGCIAIQETDAPSANVGNGIALSFRSAIRVAITVPGAIDKDLTIRSASLRTSGDTIIGTILLRNNGNVSLDTAITSTLQSLLNTNIESISGTYPALPQTITELNFEYKRPFWGGLYKLKVDAKYNANTNDSVGEGQATESITYTSGYTFIMPTPIALVIQIALLVLIVGGCYVAYKKYIVQRRVFKTFSDYTVQDGEDLETIAEQHATDWKLLATANNLKPPYHLVEGSIIKVPVVKTTETKTKNKVTKSSKKNSKAKTPKKTAKKGK